MQNQENLEERTHEKISLTLLVGVVIVRFFPETLLLRMRLKLCLKDFFKDLTLDRGPSIARESLGCSVHLREEQQSEASCATTWCVSDHS